MNQAFGVEAMVPLAIDLFGFAAAGATLCAFSQTRMLPMRISALAANLLFVAYGMLGPFYPVLLLHLVLFPVNLLRLLQELERSTERSPTLIERAQMEGHGFQVSKR